MVEQGVVCLACRGSDLSEWAAAEDIEYHSVPDRFRYYLCADCAALSISPVPADRLAEIYPANYYSFRPQEKSFAQRVKNALDRRRFRKVLSQHPGEALAVLDVGGGSGHQLDLVRSADRRVKRTVIVDFDRNAEQLALDAGHEFVAGRIEDVDPEGQFDLILLLNLIEHVEDPGLVLRKIRSLLKPQGAAVIQTPNYQSLDASLFRRLGWGGLHCPRHWVLFTPDSFSMLVDRSGLRIDQWTYTQGAPFWAVSVLGAAARAGWADISSSRPAYLHPLYPVLSILFAALDFARKPFSRLSQTIFVLRTRESDQS